MIVALHIEHVLRDARCDIIGPVGTLQSAMMLAHEEAFDVAIGDVNLDGDHVFPVANELQSRGVPFILATGYGEATLPEKWLAWPRLSKPFTAEQLEQLIKRIASR